MEARQGSDSPSEAERMEQGLFEKVQSPCEDNATARAFAKAKATP